MQKDIKEIQLWKHFINNKELPHPGVWQIAILSMLKFSNENPEMGIDKLRIKFADSLFPWEILENEKAEFKDAYCSFTQDVGLLAKMLRDLDSD